MAISDYLQFVRQQPNPLQVQQQGLALQQMAGQVAVNRQIQAENALKIQAMKEDQQDQQTFQDALQQNTKIGDDGKVTLDWDSAMNQAMPRMRLRNITAIEQDHLKMQQGMMDLARSKSLADQDKWNNLKQQHDIQGQYLYGLYNAPDDQAEEYYQDAKKQMIAKGLDVSGLPDHYPGRQILPAWAAQYGFQDKIIKEAEAKALEEQRAAIAEQRTATAQKTEEQNAREDINRRYQGVTDQASHDLWQAWLQKKYPQYSDEYAAFKDYSDDNADAIRRMTMTGQQQAVANDRAERTRQAQEKIDTANAKLQAAGSPARLAQLAYDPTVPDEVRKGYMDALNALPSVKGRLSPNAQAVEQRFDIREADKGQQQHNNLQRSEQDQWALRQQYGDLISAAQQSNSPTVKDPKTGRDIPVAQAQTLADLARAKATQYQNDAKQIRQRFGWGEFQPNQAQPAQPSAPPVQPGQPRTATNAKGEKVIWNGQAWVPYKPTP